MKCSQIKILLADYLDKSLPDNEMAIVKEHLAECKDCRQEFQFLKQYRNRLASYPTLKAPDDFLAGIHHKINASRRGAVVQKLFYPLRIKVPLEAAAVLVAAVTVVLLFNPFKQDMQEYKTETPLAITKEKAGGPKRNEERAVRERKPAHIARNNSERTDHDRYALADKKTSVSTTQGMVDADTSIDEKSLKTDAGKPAGGEAEISLYLKKGPASVLAVSPRVTSESEKSVQKEESSTLAQNESLTAKKGPAYSRKSKKDAQYDTYKNDTNSIKALVHSLGGRIIAIAQNGTSPSGRKVTVEIPASKYDQLLNGLYPRWIIEKQMPALLPRNSGVIVVHINLNE
jgi:hypothetical protein